VGAQRTHEHVIWLDENKEIFSQEEEKNEKKD